MGVTVHGGEIAHPCSLCLEYGLDGAAIGRLSPVTRHGMACVIFHPQRLVEGEPPGWGQAGQVR